MAGRLTAFGLAVLLIGGMAAPAQAASVAAKKPPPPPHLTGYPKDVIWEVDSQNLTCSELNDLRFLMVSDPRKPRHLGGAMSEIESDPHHSGDSASDIFGPILRAYAGAGGNGSPANADGPADGISHPGELKMLTALDIAAKERNCPKD